MTIHSLYIYDRCVAYVSCPQSAHIHGRHCICIYYQDWQRTRRPKPAVEGGILPAVSQAVSPQIADTNVPGSIYNTPRNTLSSGTGIVLAVSDNSQPSSTPLLATPPVPVGLTSTGLAFDEEAKLVYGVILSLRNMIKKLSGRYDAFHSFCPRHQCMFSETNNSSITEHPRTSFTSLKLFRDTNSSCLAIPTPIPSDSSFDNSTLVRSLNTSFEILL